MSSPRRDRRRFGHSREASKHPIGDGGDASIIDSVDGVLEHELPAEFRVTSPIGWGDSPCPVVHSSSETQARETDSSDYFKDVRCPVCLDPFESPVTLSCNHNVCKDHIADLAAAVGERAADESPFFINCPKCREATRFDGLRGVRVNGEMRALVAIVQHMITAPLVRDPAKSGPSPHAEAGTRPGVAGASGASAAPVLPSALRRGSAKRRVEIAEQTTVSDTHAHTPLRRLDSQLATARAQARAKREAEVQKKIEAFKQERLAMIEQRHSQVAPAAMSPPIRSTSREARPIQLAMLGAGADIADSESQQPPVGDDQDWHLVERQFSAMKREREAIKEAKRAQRDALIQQQVQAWINREKNVHQRAGKDTGDDLRRSQKVRAAEGMVDELLVNHSPAGAKCTSSPCEPNHLPDCSSEPLANDCDEEVERALWEVERRVLREHDEELTRARMADIAEQRARAMLGALKGKGTKAPTKPTYVPKLQRLHKIE